MRLIEGRNTGFPNALKALRDNGSDLLTFNMDDNRTYLSVTIPVHDFFYYTNGESDKKTSYEKEIIEKLKENPLTITELAHAMGAAIK